MQLKQTELSSVLKRAKQEREATAPKLREWAEASIWTESMLAALDNGVKGGKWYSLIDKLYQAETLEIAWLQVERNRGTCGIDEISIERFRNNKELYLKEIGESLKSGTYSPEAVKRVWIPKIGGRRPLGIPTVKERIVQTALKMVIEPIFENEFIEMSYGFRPGKSCKDALKEVDELVKSGKVWYVDADIKSYFDNISHEYLMERIKEKISDGRINDLIETFLKQEIFEGVEKWRPVKGTPQGAVLSPLLANIYLNPLDKEITESGYRMVRYADDFVILCDSEQEAQQALKEIEQWLSRNKLELNKNKTRIGNCSELGKGFEFLGYLFESGRRYVRVKSYKVLKDKIREQTKRNCGKSITRIITEINPMLRGWFEYFKHAYKRTYPAIDGFVRRRLRAIKRRQQNRSGQGHCLSDHVKMPNAYFASLGLFTMKEAWVIASQSR